MFDYQSLNGGWTVGLPSCMTIHMHHCDFFVRLLYLVFNQQHKLEGALLALGQFQHALAEVMAWLTHTEELLDAQRPINGDPRVIEVELAKHHVSSPRSCILFA